jgi:hypothetical protein
MNDTEVIEAVKAVTEVLKLNQHPATQLSPAVKKRALESINLLLQMIP